MVYTLDDVLRAIQTGVNDTLYYMFKAFCVEGAISGLGCALTQPAGAQVPSGKRTATRIVAASNSLDKTRADYVCDGIHDEEEINRAISDISATGGTVILLEGIYNVGSAGIRSIQIESSAVDISYGIYITSNVSLVGQGKSTILILDSNNFNGSESNNAFILSDNQNVEISGLVIDGSSYSTAPVFSILLFNTSNSSVYNCTIQRFSACGICMAGSSYNYIANNTISNCGLYGIYIAQSSNCIISNNVCNTNGIGIGLFRSNGNIVSNNECCNSTLGVGIGLFMSSSNYVSGNVCINNEYGIDIEGRSCNNVVCNNIVYMNRGDGITIASYSDDNLISGNLIAGNSQSGAGMYSGIVIWSGSNNTISDNVVRHTSMQQYGIRIISYGTRTLVINNDLYQAGTSADFYDEGTDTVYHNNRTTQGWIP